MTKSDYPLRFPIGEAASIKNPSKEQLSSWIETIENFLELLRILIVNIKKEQLDLRYRKEGWTIKQVIHHCADSHMNSYIRFKLAITEQTPTIKPYKEDLWAELPDYDVDIELSLDLLNVLHKRWTILLKNLDDH